MNTSEFSSFLNPTHDNTELFTKSNSVARQESVEVDTLNCVIPHIYIKDNPSNIYLKIDTQGYDREVLNGASEFLHRIVALQTEMSVTAIYDGMTGYIEMLKYLNDKHFIASGFFPVNSKPALRLIEFDCCLVNADLLDHNILDTVDTGKKGDPTNKMPI
jgi:hypothetical protein